MKSVRYEHAILLSATFDYCAQLYAYVKAASSPQLHKSLAAVLIVVSSTSPAGDCVGFVWIDPDVSASFERNVFEGEKEKRGSVSLPLSSDLTVGPRGTFGTLTSHHPADLLGTDPHS